MKEIISWCNDNQGFLTAILSVVGLIFSAIAIIVSLNTARMPYKKALKLTTSKQLLSFRNGKTQEITNRVEGLSVNAANIGARNINITFLGLCFKDKDKQMMKLIKIIGGMEGNGILAPTEISSNTYKTKDIVFYLSQLNDKEKVYAAATDSEGKTYKIKVGKAEDVLKNLKE